MISEELGNTFKCEMEDCPHCAYERQQEYEAELEKEAAIDFLKWIGGSFSFGNIRGKWYLHENTDKEYTEEELYQLYLKS